MTPGPPLRKTLNKTLQSFRSLCAVCSFVSTLYTPREVWAAFQGLPSMAKLCENGNRHIRSTWLKIKQYYKGRLLVEFLDEHGKKKLRY